MFIDDTHLETSPRIRFARTFDLHSLHKAAGGKGDQRVSDIQFVAIRANITWLFVGVQEHTAVAAFGGFELQLQRVVLKSVFVNKKSRNSLVRNDRAVFDSPICIAIRCPALKRFLG